MSDVATRLLDHCLGDACPMQVLLNTGAFPPGWDNRYLELLESAKAEYAVQDMLPRELVAAIYCASVYCTKRYHDWQQLTGGANTDTETRVRTVRWAGDEFAMGWYWRRVGPA